jgi:WD40 repeat protein
VLTGHTGRVFGMVLEKSHRSVVWSCSWDKMILVWDVQSKRLIAECSMDAHKDAVSSLSQIGGMIWSTSWDKSICQWHTLGLMDVVQATKLTDFDTFAQLLRVPANFSTIYASMPKSTVRRSNMLGSGSGPLLGTGSGSPLLSLSLSGIGASALKTGKQLS